MSFIETCPKPIYTSSEPPYKAFHSSPPSRFISDEKCSRNDSSPGPMSLKSLLNSSESASDMPSPRIDCSNSDSCGKQRVESQKYKDPSLKNMIIDFQPYTYLPSRTPRASIQPGDGQVLPTPQNAKNEPSHYDNYNYQYCNRHVYRSSHIPTPITSPHTSGGFQPYRNHPGFPMGRRNTCPDPPEYNELALSPTLSSTGSSDDKKTLLFPEALYAVLEKEENNDWIKWSSNGTSFKFNDYEKLLKALTQYGVRARMKPSVSKNLNDYQFRRLSDARKRKRAPESVMWHVWQHDDFKRGHPDSIKHMVRRKGSTVTTESTTGTPGYSTTQFEHTNVKHE